MNRVILRVYPDLLLRRTPFAAPLALQSDRKFTFLHSSSATVVLEQDETFLTRRIEALSVSPKESYNIQSFGQITESSQRKKSAAAARNFSLQLENCGNCNGS